MVWEDGGGDPASYPMSARLAPRSTHRVSERAYRALSNLKGHTTMWKLIIAFVLFAALALYLLSKGGDVDISGEKHGIEEAAPAASEAAAPAASAAVEAASAASN